MVFLETLSEIFNGGVVALLFGRRPLIALRLGWLRLSRQVLGRFTADLMLFLPIPVQLHLRLLSLRLYVYLGVSGLSSTSQADRISLS